GSFGRIDVTGYNTPISLANFAAFELMSDFPCRAHVLGKQNRPRYRPIEPVANRQILIRRLPALREQRLQTNLQAVDSQRCVREYARRLIDHQTGMVLVQNLKGQLVAHRISRNGKGTGPATDAL